MYLTHNSSVFDAQYRNISKNPTNGSTEPHFGIYDPAGDFHSTALSQQGLPQINANHWATGENHSETLPQWNYLQILTHYYTGIHVEDITGRITPFYRWNPLDIVWTSSPQPLLPPAMMPNSLYSVTLDVKNSGAVDWSTVRPAYQWKNLNDVVVSSGVGNDISNRPKGFYSGGQNLVIQTPPNGGTYKLIIDMQVNGSYFYNREVNYPWYPVVYLCEVGNGGQCEFSEITVGGGGIYLPIIMKNAS